MVEELMSELDLTDKARLLQVYGSQFSTVSENGTLYLLGSTKVSKYNVIATIDNHDKVTIIDRNKVDKFIDWSNEHKGNAGKIDRLHISKIIAYLLNYLKVDRGSLYEFKKYSDEENPMYKVISQFDINKQQEIQKGLNILEITGVPVAEAYTEQQMVTLYERGFYYACYDLDNQKFEITNNGDFKKTTKNGSCGSWRGIQNSPNKYAFFFQKCEEAFLYMKDLDAQINSDIAGSPYAAANRFLTLEDKFTKAIDRTVKQIIDVQGSFETSKIYYSNVDPYVEAIAKEITEYKKTTSDHDKFELKSSIRNLYMNVYSDLRRTQDSLRDLHETKEKLCNN